MSTTTGWPSFNTGDEVNAPDIQSMGDALRTLVGNAVAGILGIQTAIPMINPFTVTPAGGMTILAGGAGGQTIFISTSTGPRYVDNALVQTLPIAAANSQTRNDLLVAEYTQTLSAISTRNNEASSGSISTVTSNIENESLAYQIVAGTPSSSPVDPTSSIPSGWVALARIVVPPSTTTLSSGNIQILPVTMQSQILSGVSGYVDVTTNQSIAGNKTFTGTTTAGGMQFRAGDTAFSGVPGLRVNTPGSILLSPIAPGNTISLGYDCPTLAGVYFGPINEWGYVSASGYNSPDGTGTFGTNAIVRGGYVHAGSSSANSFVNVGDGVFERDGTSGCIFLGNSGSSYLFYDGTNYNFGHGPNTIGANVNVNGAVVASSGFMTPDGGSVSVNAFQFGNNSTSTGLTGIGSRGAAVNGITPSILNVENIGVAQLLALDSSRQPRPRWRTFGNRQHLDVRKPQCQRCTRRWRNLISCGS